jgi:hypothetical protein
MLNSYLLKTYSQLAMCPLNGLSGPLDSVGLKNFSVLFMCKKQIVYLCARAKTFTEKQMDNTISIEE